MDDADLASEREERFREAAIDEARHRAAKGSLFGACRNCGDLLDAEHQPVGFCAVECRDDWTARDTARSRQGVRFPRDE